MSLLEDVVQAANDIKNIRDVITADADKLVDLITGPASGPASAVDLGGSAGIVKTPARVLAETEETLASGIPAGIAFISDFDGATDDSDPGSGRFRFGPASGQSSATIIRIDLADAYGGDIGNLLDEFSQSTSVIKGHVRIAKLGDRTRWLVFRVLSVAAAAGYVNVSVTNVGASGANPFVAGDRCLIAFRATGDKGNDGAGSGDVVSDDTVTTVGRVLAYSSTNKHVTGRMISELIAGAAFGPWSNIPLAATTDIGAANTIYVAIAAGTGPVTSFGTSRDQWFRIVRADVAFTVVRDATNLETPNQNNISLAPGDMMIVARDATLSSGRTRVIAVFRSDGRAYRGPNNVPEDLSFSGIVTPPQILSSQNDYAPAGLDKAYIFCLSSDASRTITGLAGGASGREVVLENVGGNPIVLADQDAGSAAANRFALGASLTIAPGKSVTLLYDAAISRWRPKSVVLPFGALATLDRITTIDQNIALSGDITPPTITANQNDYNPAGLPTASVLRLATDATRTLTGLAGGADGRLLCIVNAGNNGILLANEDTNSAPANRFSIGANLTIAAGQSVMLLYDAVAARWRALSAGAAGGGGGGPTVWGVFNARLTPATGVPVVRTAVAGATQLFLTAYNGGQIGLYDGSSWNVRALGSDKSVRLTDTQLCTTTNGNATVTVTDSSQLIVGMEISGTGAPTGATIASIVNQTTITMSAAANASGTNNLTFKVPANTGFDVYVKDVAGAPKLFIEKRPAVFTAPTFALQDGVAVKNGDPTMRHAGAFMSANTSGTIDYMMSGRYRFPIWNRYNPVHHQHVEAFSASGTWYLSLATLHVHSDVAGGSGRTVIGADGFGNPIVTNGGNGGRSFKRLDASALSASVTVTVGGAGGSSSFGTYHSATGGTNGVNGQDGSHGSGSGGDVNFTGQGASAGLGASGWVVVTEAVER